MRWWRGWRRVTNCLGIVLVVTKQTRLQEAEDENKKDAQQENDDQPTEVEGGPVAGPEDPDHPHRHGAPQSLRAGGAATEEIIRSDERTGMSSNVNLGFCVAPRPSSSWMNPSSAGPAGQERSVLTTIVWAGSWTCAGPSRIFLRFLSFSIQLLDLLL